MYHCATHDTQWLDDECIGSDTAARLAVGAGTGTQGCTDGETEEWMIMVEQWWVDAARHALENFRVLDFVDDGWKRITAEADTGSIYQAYAVPSRLEVDGGEWLVVVRHPWERMYEKSPGMFTTAEYFASKWGKPGARSLDQMHGGDLYACMKTVSMLVPFRFPQPEEYLGRESA